jgi:hypothetical protein
LKKGETNAAGVFWAVTVLLRNRPPVNNPSDPDGTAYPDRYEQRAGYPVLRLALLAYLFRPAAVLLKQVRRNHFQSEKNAKGHDNEVVQVAKNRDEVGNKVHRTESIRYYTDRKYFYIPWDSGIPAGKVKHIKILL